MFIQFVGYDIGAVSRIYNFDVMDPPRKAREFTVEIESKTSGWGSLKIQDGPSICFERLRRELERETPQLCAVSHLRIAEQDIQEYLARQHPREKAFRYKSEWANPLSPHRTEIFPIAEKPATDLRNRKPLS